MVEDLDVLEYGFCLLDSTTPALLVEQLGLQSRPERLNQPIVLPVARCPHG